MILNDYFCADESCSEYKQEAEFLLKKDDPEPTCHVCSKPLQKKPSAIKSKHVSWSTWRI